MIRPLNDDEKKSLKFLNNKFEKALLAKDIKEAEKVVGFLQELLLKGGQETKLMKYKALLFELYMDLGYYSNAESGFIGISKKAATNTRIYLESIAMLAICYIRKGELEKAEPLIQQVLKDEKVIKSQPKRLLFRKGIIERFNEEGLLFAVKSSNASENTSLDELHTHLEFLENYSDEELYSFLGSALPEDSVSILVRIDSFTRKQLPSGERLLLPSPVSISDKEEVGKKIFKSLKRTFYNALCDPNSEFYKTWSKGLTRLTSGVTVVDAVYAVIKGKGINISIFISPFVALIVRFGIEWYCTHNRPTTLADLR